MRAETGTVTVSVVTPSYNQGEFIAETIESVLAQEGDFAIDYLVMDGGSTDGSVSIIEKYALLLEKGDWPVRCRGIRFRWVSEQDAGQADALAKGFGRAEGEILAWLNSDDVYLRGALQAAVEAFAETREAGLLYGDAHYCDAVGTVIGRYRTAPFDYERLAGFNFICQPATFFRREAFDAAGGIDATLRFAMDYDLWVRIGSRFPCRYLPQFLAKYRLHEASKTIRDETLYENSEEALRLAMKYFDWAPLTRVYNSCSFRCRSRIGSFPGKELFVFVATLLCSMIRSVRLNRGIDRRDLRLLTPDNFHKLFRSRLKIMTGGRD